MSKDTGGPAFPTTQYANGISPSGHDEGMTLRDYAAFKAMQGFCANEACFPTEQIHFDNIAEDAYRLADAMIRARKEGGEA